MPDLDIANPSDSAVQALFPSNERASRTAALALLNGAAFNGGTSGGSANAQTVTVDMTGWSLASGAIVYFIAGFTSTSTSVTFQVNATTARSVRDVDTGVLGVGAIKAGRLHFVYNDGTVWRLLNPAPFSASTSIGSGTSFTVSGVPELARRLTIDLDGVSTNGSSSLGLRLGDAGGLETNDYSGNVFQFTSSATTVTNFGALSGFTIDSTVTAATATRGRLVLERPNPSSNRWTLVGSLTRSSTTLTQIVGDKTTSSALTQFSIYTLNGVDVFDAGTVAYRID